MFDNSDLKLQRCSYYYFDQQGKSIRPMIMLLMAKVSPGTQHLGGAESIAMETLDINGSLHTIGYRGDVGGGVREE
jgi:geranylgeranyl pyrophosphate synthase